MTTEAHNLSMEELEALGQEFSAWAESDDFFEALENATVLPRTPETAAEAEKLIKAATRGRPTLSEATRGHSPTVNARVTPDIKERLNAYIKEQNMTSSEVIREALDSFLPKAA